MKRILVIQIKQIGDCILTEPVFSALKNAFPGCRTCFVVGSHFSPLFQGNPFIDEVISYDFKKPLKAIFEIAAKKFDIIFDFLGNPRSRLLTFFARAPVKIGFKKTGSSFFYGIEIPRADGIEYTVKTKFRFLSALGIKGDEEIPKIYLKQAEKDKFAVFRRNFSSKFLIAVSPVSRRSARRWEKEYFAQLSDGLLERCPATVVFLWGPGEEEYIEEIISMTKKKPVVAPSTNLRDLAALLSNCDLLITNCNGMRHISVAVGTPTLTIHGPTHWQSWQPPGERHRVVFADVPCLFCGKRKCEDMRCMKQLKPVTVEKAAVEMLKV